MHGRKRISPLKKTPAAISCERALSAECILEHFGIQSRINRRFSAEKSSFALLVVAGEVSPEEHSSPYPRQGCDTGIRRRDRVGHGVRICGNVMFYGCIAGKKGRTNKGYRDSPLPVRLAHTEWR